MLYLLFTTGFSDPYVQILLMPERRFKIKAVKTDYKNKDLNPTYYKEFKMYVRVFIHANLLWPDCFFLLNWGMGKRV